MRKNPGMTRWEEPRAVMVLDSRPRDSLRRLFKRWGHCSPASDADDSVEALYDDGWSLVDGLDPGTYHAHEVGDGTWRLERR